MYQVKIFSSSTPHEVERQVNEWLSGEGQARRVRVVHLAPTDVIEFSSTTGMQRFTLVVLYEVE